MNDIKELSDLPKVEVQRLESFFRVYKDLPEGRKKVELNGFNDAATAKQEIKTGLGCLEREKTAAITHCRMALALIRPTAETWVL